jgi:DNA-binding MarR family transcriptional regulator
MYLHAGPDRDQVRTYIHDHLKALFNIEDSSGIELFVMLQRVAHLSRLLDAQPNGDMGLSGPRWRLLLRLFIEEELGNRVGLTPTVLSHSQRVSKNTISALLRRLEAQGLIQRALDASDLRAFRIQLTQAGRDYLHNTTPRRLEGLNSLLSGLDLREREQLTLLLDKLQRSLLAQYHNNEGDPDCAAETPDQECTRQ